MNLVLLIIMNVIVKPRIQGRRGAKNDGQVMVASEEITRTFGVVILGSEFSAGGTGVIDP